MPQVTIGGERLGSGNRMKAYMHNYERSTHDLSYVWRSTMAAGTLVPFMTEVALPGDTFDINLHCEVLTHPTIGPLFGTYKVQLDVFQVPIRLYQAQLHMNMLNIGRDMSKVLLPQLRMGAQGINPVISPDNQQINPSCIFSYLGMRGLGLDSVDIADPVVREFNAVPFLGYWDIYKNYYANKQEEVGAVIHKNLNPAQPILTSCEVHTINAGILVIPVVPPALADPTEFQVDPADTIIFSCTGLVEDFDPKHIGMTWRSPGGTTVVAGLSSLYETIELYPDAGLIIGRKPKDIAGAWWSFALAQINPALDPPSELSEPQIVYFDLTNIDDMRLKILQHNPANGRFLVDKFTPEAPYNLVFQDFTNGPDTIYNKQYGQEGLALKTYNSDLFNNWISTDWIDGPDGISAITAIDTSGGSFTIDELNLSQKIYNMLNRIAISGGSYDDWLDAVYTEERTRSAENPMYLGGLIKNLIFQEVVSNATSIHDGTVQPLGTLAGKGRMGDTQKGGHIIAKIDEPSYIMGIISITPNIDYSQGNKWDTNLVTMNDFHKPALDAIGFQDLITDQMSWWDTRTDSTTVPGGHPTNIYRSAGKQPAWINYMTNVNVCRGNFAEQAQQMWMTLNRRYEANYDPIVGLEIRDLTTYIDPSKFNHIFADTSRDAQNFWAQIAVNIEARRKMSAKVIPNL